MKRTVIFLTLILIFNLSVAQVKNEQNKYIAITFDDLPFVTYSSATDDQMLTMTDSLIKKIKQFDIPAIGFSNESKLHNENGIIEKRVVALQKWLDNGLELGNHTYSHKDFNKIFIDEWKKDVIKGEPTLKKLLSEKGEQLRYFRFPFLHMGNSLGKKDSAAEFLKSAGYKIAPVTVDNSDYIFAVAYNNAIKDFDENLKKKIADEYIPYMLNCIEYYKDQSINLFGYEVKQILLMHANRLNADTFDKLAEGIKSKGYEFISIEEALTDKAYLSEDKFVKNGGISSIHRWAITKGKTKEFFQGEPEVPEFVQKASGL